MVTPCRIDDPSPTNPARAATALLIAVLIQVIAVLI
jgi:hypothetical protein